MEKEKIEAFIYKLSLMEEISEEKEEAVKCKIKGDIDGYLKHTGKAERLSEIIDLPADENLTKYRWHDQKTVPPEYTTS